LLGNVGRPGGGIVALRGHASIQGSTDIATLYDLHPGYLKTPNARRNNQHLAEYVKDQVVASSYWSGFPSFIVSQLKAWFGDGEVLEGPAGGALRQAPHVRHPDGGVLPANCQHRGGRRLADEHATADPVPRQGRGPARRRPQRHLVHGPPRTEAEGVVQGQS